MHAHTWVSSLFFFYERDCSTLLACLLASIQPRTSPSKFGGKFNSIFIRLLRLDGLRLEMSTQRRSSKRSSSIGRLDDRAGSTDRKSVYNSRDEKDIMRKKQQSISLEDTLSTAVPSPNNSRMLQGSTMQSTTFASLSQQPSMMKSSRLTNSIQDMSFSRSSFHPVLPAGPYRGKPRKPGRLVLARESKPVFMLTFSS